MRHLKKRELEMVEGDNEEIYLLEKNQTREFFNLSER